MRLPVSETSLTDILSYSFEVIADFFHILEGSKSGPFAFLRPLGLRATCTVHLYRPSVIGFRLIGKLVVNLVLIELFARCYSWGATCEYRSKIGVFAPTRSICPQNFR